MPRLTSTIESLRWIRVKTDRIPGQQQLSGYLTGNVLPEFLSCHAGGLLGKRVMLKRVVPLAVFRVLASVRVLSVAVAGT